MQFDKISGIMIGDSKIGKTEFIRQLKNCEKNPSEQKQALDTVCDFYECLCPDSAQKLHLWDTSGADEFECFRTLIYKNVDFCLLCFSFADPASFFSLDRWVHELRQKSRQDVPIVLMGLQINTKNNSLNSSTKSDYSLNPSVSSEMARIKAFQLEAGYVEYDPITGAPAALLQTMLWLKKYFPFDPLPSPADTSPAASVRTLSRKELQRKLSSSSVGNMLKKSKEAFKHSSQASLKNSHDVHMKQSANSLKKSANSLKKSANSLKKSTDPLKKSTDSCIIM